MSKRVISTTYVVSLEIYLKTKMTTVIFVAIMVTLPEISAGLLAQFIGGAHGRSSKCTDWSAWGESDCFSTADPGFMQRLPRNCKLNPLLKVTSFSTNVTQAKPGQHDHANGS